MRCLNLLRLFTMAADEGITVRQLAAGQGVHKRTIYRDLQALKDVPIEFEQIQDGGSKHGAVRWRLTVRTHCGMCDRSY